MCSGGNTGDSPGAGQQQGESPCPLPNAIDAGGALQGLSRLLYLEWVCRQLVHGGGDRFAALRVFLDKDRTARTKIVIFGSYDLIEGVYDGTGGDGVAASGRAHVNASRSLIVRASGAGEDPSRFGRSAGSDDDGRRRGILVGTMAKPMTHGRRTAAWVAIERSSHPTDIGGYTECLEFGTGPRMRQYYYSHYREQREDIWYRSGTRGRSGRIHMSDERSKHLPPPPSLRGRVLIDAPLPCTPLRPAHDDDSSSKDDQEAKVEAKEEAAPSRISRRTSTADGALKSAMQADAKAQTSKRRASVAGKKAPPAAGTDNDTLLKLLSQKKYVDQAQWFLNAYWDGAQDEKGNLCFAENPEERERVWEYFQSCHKYDKKLAEDGNELDEYEAHMFLEKNMGALTVKKLRETLAEIDVDFNQKVSLTEFLIYHYKIDYNYLVNAVMNDEVSERLIAEAKALVAAAQAALAASQAAAAAAAEATAAAQAAADEAAAEAARAAEAEQKAVDAEAQAVADEAAAVAAEAQAAADEAAAVAAREAADAAVVEIEKLEALAQAALDELNAQQKAYDDEIASLTAASTDESKSSMKRNMASITLAQLQQKDPLPLNTAKINQGAAVRKVTKAKKACQVTAEAALAAENAAKAARAAATAAREAAEAAAAAAEAAAEAAVVAQAAAEAAVLVAEEAVDAASIALEEVKEKCQSDTTQGTLWWMDREWEEAKKFMSEKMIAKMEARRAAKNA